MNMHPDTCQLPKSIPEVKVEEGGELEGEDNEKAFAFEDRDLSCRLLLGSSSKGEITPRSMRTSEELWTR